MSSSVAKNNIKRRSAHAKTGWVGANETVTIAGMEIGGMVYVGTNVHLDFGSYPDKTAIDIDPSLKVSPKRINKDFDTFGYLSTYTEMSPVCRRTYLQWLSTGRSDASYSPYYMLLYFCGLERRFFSNVNLSKPADSENKKIFLEVQRLQKLYPHVHWVKNIFERFLDIAQCIMRTLKEIQPIFNKESLSGKKLPLSIKYAIGAHIATNEKIHADLLFSWYLYDSNTKLLLTERRCIDELVDLFRIRFNEQFPQGMQIRVLKLPQLEVRYIALSGEFYMDIDFTAKRIPIPDIQGMRVPRGIRYTAEKVLDELGNFIRLIGRNPNERGSIKAYDLLPKALQKIYPCKELESIADWLRETVPKGGIVPASDFIRAMEGSVPQQPTKKQLLRAVHYLERLGFGFEPDPRYALRLAKISDPIVIFSLGNTFKAGQELSAPYRSTQMCMAIGIFMFDYADEFNNIEHNFLSDIILKQKFISEYEKQRLFASLLWMRHSIPSIAAMRKFLKNASSQEQELYRNCIVKAVYVSGNIEYLKIAAAEKLYAAMGLDTRLAHSDIYEGGKVSASPNDGPAKNLDKERIEIIQSDTNRVSSVLGNVFEDAVNAQNVQKIATVELTALQGLDNKHARLVELLITKNHWSSEEFQDICAQTGVLSAGAVEEINEWAYEHYNEALVEEHEGYDISHWIVENLKKGEK